MKKIIALDCGTTSIRAIIFDKFGNNKGMVQKEFTQYINELGHVEQDAIEILNVSIAVIKELLKTYRIKPELIDSLGITNQRETTVIWDKKTGIPIHKAVVWQSRQSHEICEQLKKENLESFFKEKTGLVIDPYFSATKIMWVLNKTKIKQEELLFGTIDTWLIWNLTNHLHLTDYSNASRTMLFNIKDLTWDVDILNKLNISKEILPQVLNSSANFGVIKKTIFGHEIKIGGVAGDQMAALFGQSAFMKGEAKCTFGTGCFILANTNKEIIYSDKGLLTTIAWGLNGEITYALEGSIFVGGSAISWLKDSLKMISSSQESEAIANDIKTTDGMYVVPAFVGLGTPYWDQDAKGAVFGLTRNSTKEHFIRATLEAIAYQTKDVINVFEELGVKINCLNVDGGATENQFLMQFLANILQKKIDLSKTRETTALGAAYLAGLHTGFYSSLDEIKKIRQSKLVYDFKMDENEVKKLYNGWLKAVEATMVFKI